MGSCSTSPSWISGRMRPSLSGSVRSPTTGRGRRRWPCSPAPACTPITYEVCEDLTRVAEWLDDGFGPPMTPIDPGDSPTEETDPPPFITLETFGNPERLDLAINFHVISNVFDRVVSG